MPRYLIERFIPHAGELSAQELTDIEQQSLLAQLEMEAAIQWIYSAITDDRMVCLYVADNEDLIREHARGSGLPIHRISEVAALIGPSSELLE